MEPNEDDKIKHDPIQSKPKSNYEIGKKPKTQKTI